MANVRSRASTILRVATGCAGLSLITFLVFAIAIGFSMPPPPLDAANAQSVIVEDRHGDLLRAFTTPDGRWRLPLAEADVDPRYIAMLLAFEDRRFYDHRGVDPHAIIRAGLQALTHGRLISGASTLTMQVARLLEGTHARTGAGKFRQMLMAMAIERRLSKKKILELYLKLAPFGGNLEGVRAASLAYFGKEPKRLSVGEAALLVAIPQSPGNRRPDQFPDAARKARARVLDQAVLAGLISVAEADHAKLEGIPAVRRAFPQLAAHVADDEIARFPNDAIHKLTIDRGIQEQLEQLAFEAARAKNAMLSVAILAVDHTTGEVLAHVGSPGYLDSDRFGAIDMASAVRSPGSTLKPLIYGLAFELGIAHPETLIEDKPTRFGAYKPKNFDEDFHGTVTVREALQGSLNIPAVKVLSAVGPARLMGRLRDIGIHAELPPDAVPSLAVALGGVGLDLGDLAKLYSSIAEGGRAVELAYHKADIVPPGRLHERPPVLEPVAAWYVGNILSGTPPPKNGQRGQIAFKTGTSFGYRDAFAVGFDGRITIAVWIGRPDGIPTPGMTGIKSAAPILFDAFKRVSLKRVPLRGAPHGVIIANSADLPPPLRVFLTDQLDNRAIASNQSPLAIAFPPDASELSLDVDASSVARPILVKAEGGELPLTFLLDDVPVATEPRKRDTFVTPTGKGFAKLSVIDAKGHVDRVTVRFD